MKEKKKLVPKRRFKGFEGEWKRRRLDEIAEINPSCTLPDFFEYVDLESVVGTELVKTRAINRTEAPSRAQRLAKKDDIFYQTVRPYQRNNYRFSLSKTNYVFSSGYAQIRPSIDSKFLFSKITTKDFVNKVLDRCTGTSFPAISPNDLSSIEFNIPTDGLEQQKIGHFFKLLDKRIANQERKIAKVKALKSAYLTEMFPQEGETVPKRRFKGFEGEWKSKTLGELSIINTGDSDVKEAVPGGKYPFFVRSKIIERSNVYTFDGEAILIPGEGNLGEIFHYFNGKFNYHQRVYKISNFDEDVDALFVYYFMHKTFKSHAMKHTVKATVDSLRLPTLKNYRLTLPNLKEQQKIGQFFKNLDDQIATEERKLAKLKAMKEAYLEEMFV